MEVKLLVLLEVGLCLGITEIAEEVKMTISQDNKTKNDVDIIFSWGTFNKFYDCMCQKSSQTCVAEFELKNDERNVKTIQSQGILPDNGKFSNYYRCLNSASRLNVSCSKSKLSNNLGNSQTFQLQRPCQLECVTIIWSFDFEKIDFGRNNGNVEINPSCNGEETSRTTQSLSVATYNATPSKTTSLVTNFNCTKNGCVNDQSGDNGKTATIIGIVVTLLALAIIAVVVFLVWRNRKRDSKPSAHQPHFPGSTCPSTHVTNQVNILRNANGYPGMSQSLFYTIERSNDDSNDYADIADDDTPKGYVNIHRRVDTSAGNGIQINNVNDNNDVLEGGYRNYIADDNTQKSNKDSHRKVDAQAGHGLQINHVNNNNDVLDDGYASIDSASLNRRDVYSKLGEKANRREEGVKNPYDMLLNPKEDVKVRQPLKIPIQTSEPANWQTSRYSLARPILDNSANLQPRHKIEVTDVGKKQPMENEVTENAYNFVDDDYQASASDRSIDTEKDTAYDRAGISKSNEPTYFELEKGEDNEDEFYTSQSKTESPYFELEKGGDTEEEENEI